MSTQQVSPQPGPISAEEWGPGYELWNAILNWLAQRGPDGTTSVVRIASHLVIVAVAVAVLWISRVQLPSWEIHQVPGTTIRMDEFPEQVAAPANSGPAQNLVRAAVPITLIPERRRTDIIQHTVEAGDTLYDIADKYQITADTLVWANNLDDNPDLLRLGQQLVILPVDGVLHTVAQGDTLEGIAKKYSAKVEDIVGFELNHLDPKNPTLAADQKIIVPAGVKPQPPKPKPAPLPSPAQIAQAPANAPRGSGRFIWPTSGPITQGFGRYHTAVDISSWVGAPIRAAESGYVAVAGWSNVGYGYYIIIDHGGGYQTLYAHLSKYAVDAGQTVERGQLIGSAGSTGNSTGPHLHLEVRYNGVGQNPFNYLP